MEAQKYKRVLIKISGEALAGDKHFGLNFDVIGRGLRRDQEMQSRRAVQIGIVVGGGNFWRGVKDGGGKMERTRADHMGMLATAINALALAGLRWSSAAWTVRVQTAIEMNKIAEPYIRSQCDPASGKGPRRHLRLRHRQPVLLDRHRQRCCARRRSARTLSCWRRISTASTICRPGERSRRVKNVRPAVLRWRCSNQASRPSWIRLRPRCPWTTIFPILVFALKDPENILRVP